MNRVLPHFGLVPGGPRFAAEAGGGVTAANAPDAILVGATISVTGPSSGEVRPLKKMMESWAEMVNMKGGIHLKGYGKALPLKFIMYDDCSKPEESARLYEKLVIQDKVHLLLGPYLSSMTVEASAMAEKHQIPFIAAEANASALFQRGFKWLVGALDRSVKWSHHYFDLIKAGGKAKTIAFIVEEIPQRKEVVAGAIPRAKEIGLRVVAEEYFSSSAQDLTPIINKVKAASPDIVYVSARPAQEITVHRQALQHGLNPREFHYLEPGAVFREAVGLKAANLVTGVSYWMPGVKGGPNVGEFKELLKRSGITVEDYSWAPVRFFAFELLRAGLEKAGTLDSGRLMATLRGLAIISISGSLKIDPTTGQGSRSPFPIQIQDGKYVTLWPPVYATGKHIYPRPQ